MRCLQAVSYTHLDVYKRQEVENVTVLYASDSILPITDSRIIHKPDISLKNVGLKNLITYYLFGSKIVKNKKLNEWIRIINNSDIIFVSPCGASIGIYKDCLLYTSIRGG